MEIKGIKYIGPVFDNSGYAFANRGNILALHKHGIPITISPISFEDIRPDFGEDGKILDTLVNKDISYNIVIIHTTPEFWERYREPDKVNIGYTVWETTKLHPTWPGYINKSVDKVIVPCSWNVGLFKDSGVTVPIGIVPHGINMDRFDTARNYEILGLDKDAFVFYFICQFVERKNIPALLKAYWRAFQDNENVALVLKTYRSNYSDMEKDIVRSTIKKLKTLAPITPGKTHPPLYMILDMLSSSEIFGLHKRCDCYVSLDRGEGWGLSTFTAGACGKPVIATGFGGTLDFAKPDNSYLVDYQLTPVWGMNWSPWYTLSQEWAEVDQVHASNLMRYVYEHRDEAKQRGLKLKEYIANNFTWEHIGKKLIEELENI